MKTHLFSIRTGSYRTYGFCEIVIGIIRLLLITNGPLHVKLLACAFNRLTNCRVAYEVVNLQLAL